MMIGGFCEVFCLPHFYIGGLFLKAPRNLLIVLLKVTPSDVQKTVKSEFWESDVVEIEEYELLFPALNGISLV